MTTYEKNLKTLETYYPEMDQMIEKAKENMESDLEVLEEESYEGIKILKVDRWGKEYYLGGKRNPEEPAQVWVDTLGTLQRNAPILMMGLGNPLYLKELVEHTENRVSIFVYEPSLEIFLKFLEMVDIEPWMEKHLIIFWVEGLKYMDLKLMNGMLSQILTYEMLRYSRHLILPNYEVLFAEKAKEFMKVCRDIALREAVTFNTNDLFANVMVRNMLSNARYMCDGYKTTQLIDVIPRDIPGIVVAAGPSLNKNVQELKKAKGRAFIVAVDTAIKPLLEAGIVPDMFVVIDALKPVELVKREEAKEIPLMITLNAAPEVLEYHTGMKIFFNEGYQFAERIFLRTGQKIGDVGSGGSVATHAFSMLYKIGIKTIILVGQDLAYTNNKSHADGTFHEIMKQEDTSGFLMVEGNIEEKVPTRDDFKLFLDWYNMYIEGCKEHEKDFRVINATEGGAKIKGTEVMSLRDAISRECNKEVNIQECLKKMPPMLNDENRKWAVGYLKNMPNDFQKLKKEAGKVKRLYIKLDKICDKKNIDRKEYLNILNKLEKQIKVVEALSTYQLVAITMNNAHYILRGEQFLQKDSLQEEGKEIARKGILYMENVRKLAVAFQEYAEEIFQDLS